MIAAQVAHAAGSGSIRHPQGVHVVVLQVRSEPELMRVAERLKSAEAPHTVIVESDEPYDGQAMAIGLELVRDRTKARSCLSCLPLLQEPEPLREVG